MSDETDRLKVYLIVGILTSIKATVVVFALLFLLSLFELSVILDRNRLKIKKKVIKFCNNFFLI